MCVRPSHTWCSVRLYPEHPHPVQVGCEQRGCGLGIADTYEDPPEVAILVHVEQPLTRVDQVLGLDVNGHQILQDNATANTTCSHSMGMCSRWTHSMGMWNALSRPCTACR